MATHISNTIKVKDSNYHKIFVAGFFMTLIGGLIAITMSTTIYKSLGLVFIGMAGIGILLMLYASWGRICGAKRKQKPVLLTSVFSVGDKRSGLSRYEIERRLKQAKFRTRNIKISPKHFPNSPAFEKQNWDRTKDPKEEKP